MSDQKILISSCLLGERVRYDGNRKPVSNDIILNWLAQGRLVSVCPEVCGGLSTPRPAAEIQSNGQIITTIGTNVSEAFGKGANVALDLCHANNIKMAILKQFSPSCGSKQIYDGSFGGVKIAGVGLTCKLLTEHGIKVFCEQTLDEALAFYEHLE